MEIYVAQVTPNVRTLGPGLRIGLWLQGCSLNCDGCMSPDMHQRSHECRTTVDETVTVIRTLAPEHVGLTVSGGEPFDQPEALALLLAGVRTHTDLDVMVYSGYTLAEIRRACILCATALSLIDVLVDGRYEPRLPTDRLWRGSSNQVMHLLSSRSRKYKRYVEADYGREPALQLLINPRGSLDLIGIPRQGELGRLAAELQDITKGLTDGS